MARSKTTARKQKTTPAATPVDDSVATEDVAAPAAPKASRSKKTQTQTQTGSPKGKKATGTPKKSPKKNAEQASESTPSPKKEKAPKAKAAPKKGVQLDSVVSDLMFAIARLFDEEATSGDFSGMTEGGLDIHGNNLNDSLAKVLRESLQSYAEAMVPVSTESSGSDEMVEKPEFKKTTGYNLFGRQYRADHRNQHNSKEMMSVISSEWKSLSEDEQNEWKHQAEEETRNNVVDYYNRYGFLPVNYEPPTKPKQWNSYQEFLAEYRRKHPDVQKTDVMVEASREWKSKSDVQKKKYEKAAEKKKRELQAEFEKLKETDPTIQIALDCKESKKKQKKGGPKPDRVSGYLLFGKFWRSENDSSGKDSMKQIGAAWGQLSDEEKNQYKADADQQNAENIASFLRDNPTAEWSVKHMAATTS